MSFFKFTPFSATMIAEGVEQAESEEHQIAAWQYLIDTNLVWKLQGFFGRTAHQLIEEGICSPANRDGVWYHRGGEKTPPFFLVFL